MKQVLQLVRAALGAHLFITAALMKMVLRFAARPGGSRSSLVGNFGFEGYLGIWWTASEAGSDKAWDRSISGYHNKVNNLNGDKKTGASVRCVRNN